MNSDSATACAACGMPIANPYQSSMADPGPVGHGVNIPTYLVQAILVTCLCCMPFGVVAIVYAAQASSKISAGDYAGARQSSDAAKMWCWIGFGLWAVAVVGWLTLALVAGLAHH
jgi:hypothetical protein